MGKVLVLNASYEPLNVTSWRRAVVLLLKEKAEQLEHNGRVIYPGMPLPSVIRLRHYVKIPYKQISLTRKNILN
ncbi:MAG: HNH endonuclease, partial [Cyanobacteria bacterium P01_H01_bin.130]